MPRKNEPTERLCIVTRETRPIGELIRFVLGPDSEVVPDLKRTLPGRGVWLTADRATVDKAEKKRLFSRAFGEEAKVAPGLADRIVRLMTESALGTLGLARKAGAVLVGFAKVDAAVARENLAGVIHAAEAADDGVRKIAAAILRRFEQPDGLPVVRSFTALQLDLALGRANVIHAALLAGRASEIFLERVTALERFERGVAATEPRIDGDGKSGDAPQD